MTYHISIYCPDRHLLYDGRTPDRKGIGGGVTARIRLADALSRLGHSVQMVCNCPKDAWIRGVHYSPLDHVRSIKTDILIMASSGGAASLKPALDLEIESKLRILMAASITRIADVHKARIDYIYACSNFLRQYIRKEFDIQSMKLYVAYYGIEKKYYRNFPPIGPGSRNPYRLIYAGHPVKGLPTALGVLRLLRAEDPRFELHIYGGSLLWGGKEEPVGKEAGVYYHGLVGQKTLSKEMQKSGFAIHLQDIPEGFGISLVEAMAAGCIPLASPAGAYGEILRDGYNGFLIPGSHTAPETQERTAGLILELTQKPDWADFIRGNASTFGMDWETIARACADHWRWVLHEGNWTPTANWGSCRECGAKMLPLADGYHCTNCGHYRQDLVQGEMDFNA